MNPESRHPGIGAAGAEPAQLAAEEPLCPVKGRGFRSSGLRFRVEGFRFWV